MREPQVFNKQGWLVHLHQIDRLGYQRLGIDLTLNALTLSCYSDKTIQLDELHFDAQSCIVLLQANRENSR